MEALRVVIVTARSIQKSWVDICQMSRSCWVLEVIQHTLITGSQPYLPFMAETIRPYCHRERTGRHTWWKSNSKIKNYRYYYIPLFECKSVDRVHQHELEVHGDEQNEPIGNSEPELYQEDTGGCESLDTYCRMAHID